MPVGQRTPARKLVLPADPGHQGRRLLHRGGVPPRRRREVWPVPSTTAPRSDPPARWVPPQAGVEEGAPPRQHGGGHWINPTGSIGRWCRDVAGLHGESSGVGQIRCIRDRLAERLGFAQVDGRRRHHAPLAAISGEPAPGGASLTPRATFPLTMSAAADGLPGSSPGESAPTVASSRRGDSAPGLTKMPRTGTMPSANNQLDSSSSGSPARNSTSVPGEAAINPSDGPCAVEHLSHSCVVIVASNSP